jgi:uncharacterized membrane protein
MVNIIAMETVKWILYEIGIIQGCQMVYFMTKNPHLSIFWRAWEGKMLVYFTAV